jgi:hypothetical protein
MSWARGHINADSGLGDWAQGLALLHGLLAPPKPGARHRTAFIRDFCHHTASSTT